ncbi:Ferric iron reductase protein FhuF [compost metagenome]
MIARLAVLPAELRPMGERLHVRPDSPAPSLAQWLQPRRLGALMRRYTAAAWPDGDRYAVASMWHQECFVTLLPPLLLDRLLLDRALPADLHALRMTVQRDGTPAEFHFCGEGRALPAQEDGTQRLDGLFEQLLLPFVSRYAELIGLAPRLLWGNAALCLDWALELAAGGRSSRSVGEARAYLADSRGLCRPLQAALKRNSAGVAQTRKVCCLRDRLELPRCAVCPLGERRASPQEDVAALP